MKEVHDLVQKYNYATPRYTSYPTVPHWENNVQEADWTSLVKKSFEQNNTQGGISIYIHLPYCESLCTYCGCNKRITKNHAVEAPYIDALIKEWSLYKAVFSAQPKIKEIHLGGGTPTFFSPQHLRFLLESLLSDSATDSELELSVEAHPGNTTEAHLETFRDLGFKRISFGIQDFDNEVQRVINRYQSEEEVKAITELSRQYGFESVNYDLVYGLPLQTLEGLKTTLEEVVSLRPDRIAYYSYAHVPWTAKGQRLYSEIDLPSAEVKLQMHELGRAILLSNGYLDMGMDHFALPNDSMSKAVEAGRLHRNFMGYTTNNTKLLIGLGVSSISDLSIAYGQNEKTIEAYKRKVLNNQFSVVKGHLMQEDEVKTRLIINQLMCTNEADLPIGFCESLSSHSLKLLEQMIEDGLVETSKIKIKMTASGRRFVRNVSALLDPKINSAEKTENMFSKAV
jgi:oxygen-independent coproporphyrinogen III oxidase